MATTVQFGPLSMTATTPAPEGTFIIERGFFDAWYSTPDSKADVRERPAGDGAFGIDRDWRTALALPMSGRFRGAGWPAMLASLQAAVSTGQGVSVTVNDALGSSSRTVSVRRFTPRPMPGAKLCYFDIDLLATDPRRYGPVQSPSTGLAVAGTGQPWPQVWPATWGSGGTPGRVTATNFGTAPTSPLLSVTGGLSAGVQLVEVTTGAYLQLDRPIPAGSTAFFNTRTSRVYLDAPANDISGWMSRRDWAGFQIPAGGTRIVQFNNLGIASGTPTLTVQFSPLTDPWRHLMALTNSWPGVTAAATTTDARKNLAGMIETDTSGVARSGLFPSNLNAVVTARADMNVDIAIFQGVAVQFGGPILIANDGVAQLPSVLVSPGSGTNYYVIYAKQNESTSPGTDASNTKVFGAQLSTASFAAARAAMPAGALELATVQMPTGKTATNNSGVVITQTHQYTAADGGTVHVRNDTELQAWAPANGSKAYRIDNAGTYVRVAGAWLPLLIPPASFTPSFDNIIVGAGSTTGEYQVTGGRCCGSAKVILGTGYAFNSNSVQFNPPVAARTPIVDNMPVGQVSVLDNGTGWVLGWLMMTSAGKLELRTTGAPYGSVVNGLGSPFTFAIGDQIAIAFDYPV